MASIFLETIDETAGEPTRHVVDAPATVGRGAECDLRLDPANRALSRIHLEVVEEADGVFVVNRASNPGTSRHDGRTLALGDRVPVPKFGALSFSLFGTEVRVGLAGTLSIAVTWKPEGAPAEDLGRHPLVAGTALLLRSGPPAAVTGIAPDAWAPPGADAAPEAQLAVYLDRGQPTMAVLGRLGSAPVTIDGAELSTNSAYLRPLESVAHAGLALELHEDGLDFRRCPTCATLNPAARATCRICGAVFAAEEAGEASVPVARKDDAKAVPDAVPSADDAAAPPIEETAVTAEPAKAAVEPSEPVVSTPSAPIAGGATPAVSADGEAGHRDGKA